MYCSISKALLKSKVIARYVWSPWMIHKQALNYWLVLGEDPLIIKAFQKWNRKRCEEVRTISTWPSYVVTLFIPSVWLIGTIQPAHFVDTRKVPLNQALVKNAVRLITFGCASFAGWLVASMFKPSKTTIIIQVKAQREISLSSMRRNLLYCRDKVTVMIIIWKLNTHMPWKYSLTMFGISVR